MELKVKVHNPSTACNLLDCITKCGKPLKSEEHSIFTNLTGAPIILRREISGQPVFIILNEAVAVHDSCITGSLPENLTRLQHSAHI